MLLKRKTFGTAYFIKHTTKIKKRMVELTLNVIQMKLYPNMIMIEDYMIQEPSMNDLF